MHGNASGPGVAMVPAAAGAAAGTVPTGAGVAAATAGCAGASGGCAGWGAVYVGAGAAAGASLSLAQAVTTGIRVATAIKDLRSIEFLFPRASWARFFKRCQSDGSPCHPSLDF